MNTDMGKEVELEFEQTDDIAELSKALCKAQGEMKGAVKDSENPHFRYKYADLSAVWDDVREPFAKNGLSVIQMPTGGIGSVSLVTQITHDSGQWIRSKLTMVPTKNDPQGIGSCITYARRYALAAMSGVYQIDDDGNQASVAQQISPDPIDHKKVERLADVAIEIVDEDSEDYSQQKATNVLNELTNDERIAMQGILKASAPEGTKKTYYSCFRDHLAKEKEWVKTNETV